MACPRNGKAGATGHVGPGGEGVTYDQVAREFGRAGWEDLSPEQRGMVERRVMERNNPVALRAYLDARISPMELVVELSGLGDVQRCLDGDWGSCAWLAVGLIPYTKVVHLARAIHKLDNLRAAVRAVCSVSAPLRWCSWPTAPPTPSPR